MDKKYFPKKELVQNAHISGINQYRKIYNESITDYDTYWGNVSKDILWMKKWDKIRSFDFIKGSIKWFINGKLNVSYNCIDRHLESGNGEKTAIIWEGNDPNEEKKFTFKELSIQVNKFANVLKSNGVKKGDRVCLYMQMIPELSISMLACARIGAVHSVVFGAFSAEALRSRINDSKCKILITQDTGVRGTKQDIPMKENADKALENTPSIEAVFIVKRTGQPVNLEKKRDIWWHEEMLKASSICKPEIMDSEDPLFILYTSGSTGKPKGVLHTTGGYILYAAHTHKLVFDYKDEDIYWCTADIGWITGHSYIVH